MFFGRPERVTGLATLGESGVDEIAGFVLAYGGGRMAVLSSALRVQTAQEALLCGTTGAIRLHTPWWYTSALTLSRPDEADQVERLPYLGNGYAHEAQEVMRCLRAGLVESPLMPLDESVQIVETMDTLRAQWGLRYPFEPQA
jgi:hypothetical protein